jgi:hypothetical protein
MKKNFNLKFKNHLYFALIILIFAHQTSFFSNAYIIYKRDYDERLLRNYGYCESHSYGYINKIYNKYLIFEKSQNAFIINFETLPESYGLFPQIKRDNSKEKLI